MAPRKSTSKSTKSFGDMPAPSANRADTSTEHLLFSGLHFYFFPNSRTNRARALRIDKASEHGAIFCQQLNAKVSHIIVDDGMHWDEFTKHHKSAEPMAKDVVIVNGRYVADCLSYGMLLTHEQRVYQVPGQSPDIGQAGKLKRIASAPSLADKVLHVNPAPLKRANTEQRAQKVESPRAPTQEYNSIVEVIGRGPTANGKAKAIAPDTPAVPSSEVPVYNDDLSAMISEAKAIAHLPVETSFGEEVLGAPAPRLISDQASTEAKISAPPRFSANGPSASVTSPDPMIMKRPSDGVWVKLRCKECGESSFSDMKAFLKHCAFLHRQRFKTQDQAIEEWGYPLKSYAPPPASNQQDTAQADTTEVEPPAVLISHIENDETQERPAKRAKGDLWQEKFTCMDKHDKDEKEENPNAYVMERLQEMADHYDRTGDRWRTLSFRKGVTTLRQQKERITTKEQALRLPNVGDSIAEAIEKIVQTGKLNRLEVAKDDPTNQVLQLFMGIYGVGLVQATKWVQEGHKTLDDIREKVQLSDNQKLGLERYDDLQLRIPRAEVEAHGDIFKSTVAGIDPDFEITIGGSYRRGGTTSGDIDLIITKPGADLTQIRTIILEQVLPELFSMGFLKAELARTSSDSGSKWHGCSAIDDGPWRRIDFLLVPWDEMGAALIYFTGNDIFNRSIRLLASRKGMRLNQPGLYKDVMRGKGREKITEGELMESASEKKIFEILGVPWRPPEHRNC